MEPLDRIYDKLEKMDIKLNSMDLSLLRNTISLEQHVKRCDLIEKDLKPIKQHIVVYNAIFKILTFSALIIGIIAGIYEIFF